MHTRAQTHKHKHTHTQEESTPTQHYTMVFTIFVLMNLFNQVPSPSPPLSPSLPLSLTHGHDGFHNAHTRRTARSIGYTHSHIHGGFFVFMRLFNYLVCLCARTTWYVCVHVLLGMFVEQESPQSVSPISSNSLFVLLNYLACL